MIHKDIRYRRHQRERVIRKRVRKLINSWRDTRTSGLESFSGSFSKPGRYAKYNMSCNCDMCRTKTREHGHKRSEERKLLRERDDLND